MVASVCDQSGCASKCLDSEIQSKLPWKASLHTAVGEGVDQKCNVPRARSGYSSDSIKERLRNVMNNPDG